MKRNDGKPSKGADIMADIFAVLFGLFAILQFLVVIFVEMHWAVKIGIGLLALFFIAVIVFLIIERKKEPPIKY